MSKLEDGVIPFIYSLIDGETGLDQLGQRECHNLARWSFKTAAALSSSISAPQHFVPESHSKEFYFSGGKKIPKDVGVFATTIEEAEFLWSFSPTWLVMKDTDVPKELLELMQRRSYKAFLQLGHLGLAVCWWPSGNVEYVLESWAGTELSGHANWYTSSEDSRRFFDKENEAFLMAIGVRL